MSALVLDAKFPAGDDELDMSHAAFARRLALRSAIGVFLFHLAFLPPGIINFDGNAMLAVAESLARDGDVTVSPEFGAPGRGGHSYSRHYPLLSFLAVPSAALGIALGASVGLPEHYVAAVLALPLSALATAAATGLVLLLALRFGATWRGAFLAAMAYAFGTIALAYAGTFFADPLLTLLTAAAVYLAMGGTRRDMIWAGIATGLAVLAKPTGAIVGPILCLALWRLAPAPIVALSPALGTLAGLAIYLGYNELRFENLWSFGQPFDFTASGIPAGALGLLASPGRGLLWYAPVAALGAGVAVHEAVHRRNTAAVIVIALFAGFLVLHASWTQWAGGWSWGPRLLLPTLPVLVAILGKLGVRWRPVIAGLGVLGFAINAPTLVSFYERYYTEAGERGLESTALVWEPRYAPLVHQWGVASRQIGDAVRHDPRELVRRAGASDGLAEGSEMLRVVAVWWWMLPVLGIPRWGGLLCSMVLLGVAGILLCRAGRLPDGLRP